MRPQNDNRNGRFKSVDILGQCLDLRIVSNARDIWNIDKDIQIMKSLTIYGFYLHLYILDVSITNSSFFSNPICSKCQNSF